MKLRLRRETSYLLDNSQLIYSSFNNQEIAEQFSLFQQKSRCLISFIASMNIKLKKYITCDTE